MFRSDAHLELWLALIGSVALVPEAQAQTPATVAEAAKVLDLADYPVPQGAKLLGPKRLSVLSYRVKATPRAAYSVCKQTLESKGFAELPGSYLSDETCSGAFGKAGFVITASSMPSYSATPPEPGSVEVRLANLGNVDLTKLPVPEGAKPLYSFPAVTSYVTEASPKQTAETLRKSLMEAGWLPFDTAGETQFFKQNAVKLSVNAMSAPGQGGKTVIQYSSELLSLDFPLPTGLKRASFSNENKRLDLDAVLSVAELATFYKDALERQGWKATTDRPFKVDFKEELIFRNAEKEIATLSMRSVDKIARASLTFQTAAELAESERLAREAVAKRKADSERRAREFEAKRTERMPNVVADTKQATVEIATPEGVKSVERKKDRLVLTLESGKARDVARTLRDGLVSQGWKADVDTTEPMAGSIVLSKKPGGTLTITYFDTGLDDAKVTVMSFMAQIVEPRK